MSSDGLKIFETIIYAFFAGLLPALIWLWFWLHEDKKNPEPRKILALTFTTGMAVIFFAIPLESFFLNVHTPLFRFTAWAAIEEILKFIAAYIVALHTRHYDEPIDAIIYLMCAALGFAALENTLFILNTTLNVAQATNTSLVGVVFMINLRFIGANLLHVLASSAIGIAIACSFKKSKKVRVMWATGGILVAILLHTAFNLFIIDGGSVSIFFTFLLVWLTLVGLILILEKIKRTSPLIS